MKSKIELISNIIDPFFKEDNITKLKEDKEFMSIDFIADGIRFLSFSFDKELPKKDFPKGIFPFLNRGEKLVCTFCDYIIFCEFKGKLFILLIELKKGKDNVTKQLDACHCFSDYLISTLNRVYNKNIVAEIRKISIRERHIKPKQKQKDITYVDNFHTFCDSKFWLKKYLQ